MGMNVGASLLAMDVNDYVCVLNKRGALAFFVGTPPGAGSLPQTSAQCCPEHQPLPRSGFCIF
ncbi:Lipoprotein [Pseudomonas sp. IT-P74]